MIRTAVVTISDKGSSGKRKDKSGKLIGDLIKKIDGKKVFYNIIPDEREIIREELASLADKEGISLIITTGGTGLAKRDITPEATLEVVEKQVPGLMEKIRYETGQITPMAYLSRGVAGIKNGTLIINLPGKPKAVEECLESLFEILPHGIQILKGEFTEHK